MNFCLHVKVKCPKRTMDWLVYSRNVLRMDVWNSLVDVEEV